MFFMIRTYKRRKHEPDSTWKFIPFRRTLNFTESNIVESLTEDNAIGSGWSSKVETIAENSSGEQVTVKKIWNDKKLDYELEEEFQAKVEKVGMIQHPNILKLLCYIERENLKLLVYEYLGNVSLDHWLLVKKRPTSISSSSTKYVVLDWPKRLKIAVGAAQGLCYMHHDCSPPFIHGDVKSSNILLDCEFNAKIADLGLAKMLIKQGVATSTSVKNGSFGYIAPEYDHTTRMSEKIDVYSFGVILLELTTGRKAITGDGNTDLTKWASDHIEGKPIVDALDASIKKPCYLNQIVSVFELGLSCTSTIPSSRPSMKEVVQVLQQFGQGQG